MLTDEQVIAIETASETFGGDVNQLHFGINEYRKEIAKANESSRLNGIGKLQRISQVGYQKVLSVLTKEQKDQVEEFVRFNFGKELPAIAATSLSQFRAGKPPKTTFP